MVVSFIYESKDGNRSMRITEIVAIDYFNDTRLVLIKDPFKRTYWCTGVTLVDYNIVHAELMHGKPADFTGYVFALHRKGENNE